MKNIGVFCSASGILDDAYKATATRFGTWIGQQGMTLVYGGSNVGLMEVMARAAHQAGAKVVGVYPHFMLQRNKPSEHVTECVFTNDLSERKNIMCERADVLVALPGGLGTLDEVFHTIAGCILGRHSKRIIFFNQDGFYDHLLTFLDQLDQRHFTRCPQDKYCAVANTLDELFALLLPTTHE